MMNGLANMWPCLLLFLFSMLENYCGWDEQTT